jgi:Thiamine monophosphate kinase
MQAYFCCDAFLCRRKGIVEQSQFAGCGNVKHMMSAEFNIAPVTAALNGGEDYELLFTIAQSDYEKIKKIEGISIIGHITDASEGVNLILNSGTLVPITAQGWNHMRK